MQAALDILRAELASVDARRRSLVIAIEAVEPLVSPVAPSSHVVVVDKAHRHTPGAPATPIVLHEARPPVDPVGAARLNRLIAAEKRAKAGLKDDESRCLDVLRTRGALSLKAFVLREAQARMSLQHTRIGDQIEFPIEVASVRSLSPTARPREQRVGAWVSVRPVGEERTYLGVYLGDLVNRIGHSYNVESRELTIYPCGNPAMFVPELKRIVWGCESWWGVIETPDDLRRITDADIENVWYVRALRDLAQGGAK